MPNQEIACGNCSWPFNLDELQVNPTISCPSCHTSQEVFVFPEFSKAMPSVPVKKISELGNEASCFYHEKNQASRVCDNCGVFICSLCNLEMGEFHYCPKCVSLKMKTGSDDIPAQDVRLYDNKALLFAFLPVFLIFSIYFTFITAPISLFIVFRYWDKQKTFLPRTKWMFIIAGLFSSVQIIAWLVFFFFMLDSFIYAMSS